MYLVSLLLLVGLLIRGMPCARTTGFSFLATSCIL